jgi:hypothetical protein
MFGWFLPIYRPDRAKPAEWKVEYEDPEDDEDETKLRDWFAGQALMGLMSKVMPSHSDIVRDVFAEAAYDAADAMLAERKRRDGK